VRSPSSRPINGRSSVFSNSRHLRPEVGEAENAVVCRENGLTDEIVEDKVVIRRHREIFEQLSETALDDEASMPLIGRRAEELDWSPSKVSRIKNGDAPTSRTTERTRRT
jgi:hypothetical protein